MSASTVPPLTLTVTTDAIPTVPPAESASVSADEDLFLRASRAFRTVEAPSVADAEAQDDPVAASAPAHAAPRRAPRGLRRKFATAGSTVAVMAVTVLLGVSMTLPSEAVAAAQGAQAFSMSSLVSAASTEAPVIEADEIQAFVAPENLSIEAISRNAEAYSTMSLGDLAAQQGIKYSDTVYTNDPNAAIQWPYVVGVAMTSRYGMRWGRMHEGIDLVPGNGAPVQAIADGVVRVASESGGGYGVHVWIDHEIDGKAVGSHYAHMQYGSLRVQPGQEVKVGDIIGLTGNTGRSYGAHLHFEISVNGSKVDPLPFMQEYAGTY